MDFDPNKKGKPVYEWATYIPDRRPKFKAHRNVGHAKNAFKYRSNAILYHMEGGEWVEKYRVENLELPETCQWCGDSTLKFSGYRTYNAGDFYWPKDGTIHMEWLCSDCSIIHYYGDKNNKSGLKRVNSMYMTKAINLLRHKLGDHNLHSILIKPADAFDGESIQDWFDSGRAKSAYKLISESFDWSNLA